MSSIFPLKMQHYRMVDSVLGEVIEASRFIENRNFIQHGTTTLYTHCRNVALMALAIADFFHSKVDSYALVRGCLLHDYYLYDWHDKTVCPHLHGYYHPGIALDNASKVFDLSKIEQDVILHHMFPLTFPAPRTREGWIICLSDKLCSIYETFKLNEKHKIRRHYIVYKDDLKKGSSSKK